MERGESASIGAIVGLAIGDALGFPAEFRRRRQLLEEIGPEGITDFVALQDSRFSRPFFAGPDHPPGTYTDDTQMTIAVAEALLQAGRDDLDRLMGEMARRFVLWSRDSKNDRAPGGTCIEGCRNLERGAAWREAGVADSKGCGSAMRTAPIGLFYDSLDDVERVARASSQLTHGHPAALEAAAAAALLVALAREQVEPEAIYREIDRRCGERSEEFAEAWRRVPEWLDAPPERALVADALGEGWVGDEAVASAMYCFWRSPDDYRTAVLTAVNTDGDSDSLGAITGSAVGARLGIDAIPANWRDAVEDSPYLHELGRRLHAARG